MAFLLLIEFLFKVKVVVSTADTFLIICVIVNFKDLQIKTVLAIVQNDLGLFESAIKLLVLKNQILPFLITYLKLTQKLLVLILGLLKSC